MKIIDLKRLCLFALPVLVFINYTADAQENTKKKFVIFDAIHYKNKPDLTVYGLKNIDLVYENLLTRPDPANVKVNAIDTAKIINRAKMALLNPNVPVCFDIESWWSIRDTAEVTRRYKQTAAVFKKYNTVSTLGFYGIGPLNLNISRWRTNNDYEKAFKGWTYYNNMLTPSRQYVDVLYPSFYIINNLDMATYVKDLEFCMKDARKNNKKVYAYIWPQYYDYLESPYCKKFIDAATWATVLETCYRLCDGVVIWTSTKDANNNPVIWGDAAMMPFWNSTLAFIKKHKLN